MQNMKEAYSHAVTHPTTSPVRQGLISVFWREPVRFMGLSCGMGKVPNFYFI